MAISDQLAVLTNSVSGFTSDFEDYTNEMTSLMGDSCDFVGTIGSLVGEEIREQLQNVQKTAAEVLGPVNDIINQINDIADQITGFIQGIEDQINAVIEGLIGQLNTIITDIQNQATALVNNVIDGVKELITDAIDIMSDVSPILGAVGCIAVFDTVKKLESSRLNVLSQINDVASNGLSAVENRIGGAVTNMIDNATAPLTDGLANLTNITNGIQTETKAIVDGIGNLAEALPR